MARLSPGGVIGSHPASGSQLLLVIEGHAIVVGGAGEAEALQPGHGALWASGEMHQTGTDEGLLALVIEGDFEVE